MAALRHASRPSVHGDGGVDLSRRLMVPAESAMRFVLLLSCLLGFAGSPAFAQADVGGGTTDAVPAVRLRSEAHTSELQSLIRLSYAIFCLKKKTITQTPI